MSDDMKIDKSKWGPGPWQDEPDRVEFEHLGFPCLIVRQPVLGHLCGYVAVPPGHPWHGKDEGGLDADAHGGLAYANTCAGNICHVPKPGEPDDVWWLGFDAAHAGDTSPGSSSQYLSGLSYLRDSYKDVQYMRAECERLAEQAKAAR